VLLKILKCAVDGVVRLAEIWRLTSTEVCALLDGVSERTWFRMKKREWSGTLSQDTLTRISALVGIFKGLRLLLRTSVRRMGTVAEHGADLWGSATPRRND
jgi:hypothetical protein